MSLQKTGGFETKGSEKRVEMELAGAYEVPELQSVLRALCLRTAGELTVEDRFVFGQDPLDVQEAFVTWFNTIVSGRTALIVGKNHVLELTIQEPAEAVFALEVLEKKSKANNKTEILKRLSFDWLAETSPLTARVRTGVLAQ
jgi:hypothetical protein